MVLLKTKGDGFATVASFRKISQGRLTPARAMIYFKCLLTSFVMSNMLT